MTGRTLSSRLQPELIKQALQDIRTTMSHDVPEAWQMIGSLASSLRDSLAGNPKGIAETKRGPADIDWSSLLLLVFPTSK
jgi:hypothetical protein